MTVIPITKAIFDERDFALIQEPLKSGWVVQGRYVREFEELFSQFSGSPYALATTSCTTALHVALAALGIGPGDEVLVPAFTWISTANAVEYLGGTPVFVDIDLATLNIDVARIEERIGERTKAIIPVHLFGLVADMDPILAIARRHGLHVVEDAACAFDAWYKGRHAGTFGDAGCFSFHPRKAITTGEGGMITTASEELARLSASLRDHGATRSDFQRHEHSRAFLLAEYPHLGFNFRMTDIQGALGVTQMQKARDIQASRREAAARYDVMLAGVPWLRLPYRSAEVMHGQQSYVCLFAPDTPSLANVEALHIARNALMERLEAEGISTRQGTHSAAHTAFYRRKYGIAADSLPRAYLAERLSITLPLYAGMTPAESERVVEALTTAVALV
jgi:perosamine synthetase